MADESRGHGACRRNVNREIIVARSNTKKFSKKDAAISFLRLVVTGKIREAYALYVGPDMRHHNMAFAGDAASLEKAMVENHSLFPHKVLDVKQALEDGDLVAVHSHVRLQAAESGFAAIHLFRFDGDRIVEMWDVGQPVPVDSPNQNGMF
jgi:predicted SnoaL-like aldol condensation-catalyzing enzyme